MVRAAMRKQARVWACMVGVVGRILACRVAVYRWWDLRLVNKRIENSR